MIIGLAGRKMVGKDTVGDYLNGYYGFRKKAFAAHLKEVCKVAFGFTYEQLNDQELKEVNDERWDTTPRKAMQYIGTSFRYEFGNEFWIKHLRLEQLAKHDHDYVITDVRHVNEFWAIKNLGGTLIRVERETGLIDKHSTEIELLDIKDHQWDFTLNNNCEFQELFPRVDAIMSELGYLPGDA